MQNLGLASWFRVNVCFNLIQISFENLEDSWNLSNVFSHVPEWNT